MPQQLTLEEIGDALAAVGPSPTDHGRVELIVARPGDGQRRSLGVGEFTVEDGLVGDNWRARGSKRTDDGGPHPQMQVALINRRFLDVVAGSPDRWALAGNQVVVDLDLTEDNLAPGDRLEAGSVLFEVTPMPHTGCAKFSERYGVDAVRFLSTPDGKRRRLRGVYVRVVRGGTVAVGDTVRKDESHLR